MIKSEFSEIDISVNIIEVYPYCGIPFSSVQIQQAFLMGSLYWMPVCEWKQVEVHVIKVEFGFFIRIISIACDITKLLYPIKAKKLVVFLFRAGFIHHIFFSNYLSRDIFI